MDDPWERRRHLNKLALGIGKLANKTSWVQGSTDTKQYSWTTRRTVDLGMGQVSHSFMVIPECPYPLLGRDLLTKMGAQIRFHPKGAKILNKEGHLIQVLILRLEDEYRLHQTPSAPMTDIDHWLREFPQAWAETGRIGLARHRPAIYIELKPGADPVRIHQYPMPLVSLTQTGTPLCMTVKKFWHRCMESELISRTSHCQTRTPPGIWTAAVSSKKESDTWGQP
ncbi:Gag-Pol polyprotein [Vulpes lagopus]